MYSRSTAEVNSNSYVFATSKVNPKLERLLSKSLTTLEVMTDYLVVHTGPGLAEDRQEPGCGSAGESADNTDQPLLSPAVDSLALFLTPSLLRLAAFFSLSSLNPLPPPSSPTPLP